MLKTFRNHFSSNLKRIVLLIIIFHFSNLLARDLDSSFINEEGIEFVKIPSGKYTMGASENDKISTDSEKPSHLIEITKDFYLGKYEVTQKQWKRVMNENPSRFQNCGEDCPVEKVSWNDANEFIKRLNLNSKDWLYDLPTEAEWEYAAKAGESNGGYSGEIILQGRNNSSILDKISWYGGNSGVSYLNGYDCSDWEEKQYKSSSCGTHPVGLKTPNAFGLYDMIGNVWEWCKDGYEPELYSERLKSGLTKDVFVTGVEGGRKIIRGGSWSNDAVFNRPTERNNYFPDYRNYNFGFRVLARPKN